MEELIGKEEKMLGFWMWGTDGKWATPETQREKKNGTRMEKEFVLLTDYGIELESCLDHSKEGQKLAANIIIIIIIITTTIIITITHISH